MQRKDLQILIVEDDPVINTDLKSFLKTEGFQVVGVASSGEKAIDQLATRDPNFAILDIHLGTGMSGIEVAEVIHEKYDIPYIFLTSFSDEETLQVAQDQGPYGYLVKPYHEATLLSTITTAWHNHRRIKGSHQLELASRLAPLTVQEKKICMALIGGSPYKQICREIFISANTLKYHVKNIYQKMDVGSRSELSSKLLS